MSAETNDPLLAWKLKHGYVPPKDSLADGEEIILLKVNADRRKKGKDYCVLCGEGPMLISEMRLITPEEDPYIQMEPLDDDDPGDPVRACMPCFKKKYEDGEEDD